MAGGTPLPSEGRLINTALEVDPNGNVNDVYVIGYLGTAATGRAALICVNLAALLAARGSGARIAQRALSDEDMAAMPALQSLSEGGETPSARMAAAEPADSAIPEMRVSVQELFDDLHEYKAAHFRYRFEDSDGELVGRCVAQTQPYSKVTQDMVFRVTTKVVSKKPYYILDTGLSLDDVSIETVLITVDAELPSPASIQKLAESNTVGIVFSNPDAALNVCCMLPLVEGSTGMN